MSSSGSPCGACKFLRRKCMRGCVFAPYFCHEEGAAHFAAIHKVFGASNVSKLLSNLKESDRSDAVTISFEAQGRLQDPIYGCVSQIFALQEKVVSLQEQLASLKELAAQCFPTSSNIANLNKVRGNCLPYPQEVHSWFESANSGTVLQFDPNITNNSGNMNLSSMKNLEYPYLPMENISSGSPEMTFSSVDSLNMQKYYSQSVFQGEIDDLSVAFSQESRLVRYPLRTPTKTSCLRSR